MNRVSERFIKVGVAYEGSLDTSYIKTLISRLLDQKGYVMADPIFIKANTAITKYVPVYASRFSNERCDIMIFLTDADGGANTKAEIRDKIESVTPHLLPVSAIGVADPHIEGWVIADETAVKSVFNIDGTMPLSFPDLKPKDRLIALLSESNYEGVLDDAKVTIASICNFNVMYRKCPDFAAFTQDINDAINYIENAQPLF